MLILLVCLLYPSVSSYLSLLRKNLCYSFHLSHFTFGALHPSVIVPISHMELMFHMIPLKPFSRLHLLFDQLPWPKWSLGYWLLRTQYISWQWFSSHGTWSGGGRGKSLGVDFLQINCGLTWTSPWVFWMDSKCSKRLINNVTHPAWFSFEWSGNSARSMTEFT